MIRKNCLAGDYVSSKFHQNDLKTQKNLNLLKVLVYDKFYIFT